MKQIIEDYVSFEIAKLLKEKGFNAPCHCYYKIKKLTYGPEDEYDNETLEFDECKSYSAPTHQMTLKWLRKIHKLDIDVSIEYKNSKKVYYYSILKKTVIRDIDCIHSETNFDSYEQTVEAALLYVLKNLI